MKSNLVLLFFFFYFLWSSFSFGQEFKDLYKYTTVFEHYKDTLFTDNPYVKNPIDNNDIIHHLESLKSLYLDKEHVLKINHSRNSGDTLFFQVSYNFKKDSLRAKIKLVHFRDSLYFELYQFTQNNKSKEINVLKQYFFLDEMYGIETSLQVVIPISVKNEILTRLQSIDSIWINTIGHINPRSVISGGSDYMEHDRVITKKTVIIDRDLILEFSTFLYNYIGFRNELSDLTCLCGEDLESHSFQIFTPIGKTYLNVYSSENYISIIRNQDQLVYFIDYSEASISCLTGYSNP